MERAITLLFSFFILDGFSLGFVSYDSTRYSVAMGMSFSTSNIRRDVTNVPYPGLDARAQLFLSKSVRLSAEYTHHFKHNLGLVWENVQSDLFEINVQYVAAINDHKSGFYTITGVAVQNWRGVYTGMGHEFEFRQYGDPQSYYSASWSTLSVGCGMQRTINKIELYGEFKYRVSKRNDNVPVSIIDVNYSFGARYNIKPRTEKSKRNSRIKMPGERYHWF